MSLGMLCALSNIHNMEGYECKGCWDVSPSFFKEKMNGTKGRVGGGKSQ
jgi:hypothetical protein